MAVLRESDEPNENSSKDHEEVEEENTEEGEVIAYDSESSDEGELGEEEESDVDIEMDIPSVPNETMFLIGGSSRFGRAIRYNSRWTNLQ